MTNINIQKHPWFFLTTLSLILISCGQKQSEVTQTSTNTSSSGPGPSSCLANNSTNDLDIFETNNTFVSSENLNTNSDWQVHRTATITNPFLLGNTGFQNDSKIVGGDSVETDSNNCQSSTNSPSATTVSDQNAVAILLPVPGSNNTQFTLCSGTIVANNLILTAAHCFDDIQDSSRTSTETSPGYVIFGNDLSGTSVPISCWQRSSHYLSCADNPGNTNCTLYDIAWVKINNGSLPNGYSAASVLTSLASGASQIVNSEEKIFSGFGKLNQSVNNTVGNGNAAKYCVSTNGNPSYSSQGGDITPSGAESTFNAQTFANAYPNYLDVIGPITGSSPSATSTSNASSSAKGTCNGDSGGPVYVYRNNHWIIAALTQGSNSILSPKPLTTSAPYTFDSSYYATCQYGYGTYTVVGPYINWIESTSGVSLSTF